MTLGITAGALSALTYAYLEMRKEREMETNAETPVMAPSLVERDKTGSARLKLDASTQQRLGIKVALPSGGFIVQQLTATARVLDAALLAGQLNEIRATQTALDAARLDYERKKKLFDHGQNASAAAVEIADGVLKQSQVACEAAQDRLAAAWGANIASRDDLKRLARSFLAREAALVRIELLPAAKLAKPETVRLLRQNGEELTTAQVLGPALNTDSPVIGQAYLALVITNATALVPGSFLVAHCETKMRDTGVVLPRDAVVRHAGLGWVYVQTESQVFTRRPIALDRPHPDGWLVTGDWKQPVVVTGAQSLLSEELKGSIQMRD